MKENRKKKFFFKKNYDYDNEKKKLLKDYIEFV